MPPEPIPVPHDGVFLTTRWSVVSAAASQEDQSARNALEQLCSTYWYPLYSYVRRRGYSVEDAQDLTQTFLARLLDRQWIGNADRSRGRFRSFLLSMLSRFLADEWDKGRAQKRGGNLLHVPLESAEALYGCEPQDRSSPEEYFERRWALTLLESVLALLRQHYVSEGKTALFEKLSPTLVGEEDAQPYELLAADLRMNVGALKVAVYRLRKRYRQLLLEQISHTLGAGEEVEDELRHLFRVISGT